MSRKYQKLTEYLANLEEDQWTARFNDIEAVLGFPLPDSARSYNAWWSNQNRAQSLSWQSAGWKATALDLNAERVTFVYVGGDPDREEEEIVPLSIAQAKSGLAAAFGVEPSQVDITIRG